MSKESPAVVRRDHPRWYPFDQQRWRRKLPPERRYVLVAIAPGNVEPPSTVPSHVASVAVGYLKFAAGCRDSPYFVVPGFGRSFVVTHWADCLGDDFYSPNWTGIQSQRRRDVPRPKERP